MPSITVSFLPGDRVQLVSDSSVVGAVTFAGKDIHGQLVYSVAWDAEADERTYGATFLEALLEAESAT